MPWSREKAVGVLVATDSALVSFDDINAAVDGEVDIESFLCVCEAVVVVQQLVLVDLATRVAGGQLAVIVSALGSRLKKVDTLGGRSDHFQSGS